MRRRLEPGVWFPFEARRWLASESVSALTLEQEGAFIRLLAHQWENGSIPADEAKLASLLKSCHPKKFAAIWQDLRSLFQPLPEDPTRLRNEFLARKREAYETKSCAAAAAVRKRWQSGKNATNHAKSHTSDHTSVLRPHDTRIEFVDTDTDTDTDNKAPTYVGARASALSAPSQPPRTRQDPAAPASGFALESPHSHSKRARRPAKALEPQGAPLPLRAAKALDLVALSAPSAFVRPGMINRGQSIALERLTRRYPETQTWQVFGEWLERGRADPFPPQWSVAYLAAHFGEWVEAALEWQRQGKPLGKHRAESIAHEINTYWDKRRSDTDDQDSFVIIETGPEHGKTSTHQ